MTLTQFDITSDWATLQLVTEGARVVPLLGHKYPSDVIFTSTGVLIGQPNEGHKPKIRTRTERFEVQVPAGVNKLTFITGHGSNGVQGPDTGAVMVIFDGYWRYENDQKGNSLNFEVFHNKSFIEP